LKGIPPKNAAVLSELLPQGKNGGNEPWSGHTAGILREGLKDAKDGMGPDFTSGSRAGKT
jgi:hypothetical protein